MHCSNLAADAVRAAIEDYWGKQEKPAQEASQEDE
jgi:NifU-like protein involved in Fe-S cluster formation